MLGEQSKHKNHSTKPSRSDPLIRSSFRPSKTSSAESDGLISDAGCQPSGRDRIRAGIQRSSRLLSLLGLRYSAHAVKVPKSSASPSRSETADNPPQTVVGYSETRHATADPTLPSLMGSSSRLAQGQREEGRQTDEDNVHLTVADKRRSQSTPVELARFVSLKLSTTFGNPTVIRRSHLNVRPNVRAVHFQPSPNMAIETSPNDSSSSSAGGNNESPENSVSTAPTSEGPSPPSSSGQSGEVSAGQDAKNNHESTRPSLRESGVSPVRESPAVSPSILTAEAAANAKIFFETYFSTLYDAVDTRKQRQYELDQYIISLPLSPEERIKVKKQWLAQEREYLRQCRVLKSRSHSSHSRNEAPSLAGFEVIKVLGKGSFGVVRLVKEKVVDSPPSSSTGDANVAVPSQSRHFTTRTDRRQIMTGVKKDVFAMKVIRKSVMIRNNQEGHLRAERDFLVASSKSRWIVPLIASFQDSNYLYLVMDYMVGGDFLGLLMRYNILSEDVTRWYVAEMILCVEEAHRLRWIHRDVKPDNFLISSSGHLKIADFGLAFDGHWAHDQWYYNYHRHSLLKRLGIQVEGDAEDQREAQEATKSHPATRRRDGSSEDDWVHAPVTDILKWRDQHQKRRMARSVVGTSQYMAPEVIRGYPYDGRCDWWSVGIILYECLYGFTPFASEDRHKTKLKIHHHLQTLYFPVHRPSDKLVSAEAIDLINSLLQEREFRLSSDKYKKNDTLASRPAGCFFYRPDQSNQNYQGSYVYADDATDIKAHPFFRGINWDDVHRMPPPFIPKVKGWEDTRYFDDGECPSDHDDDSTDSDVDRPKDETATRDEEEKHQGGIEQPPKDGLNGSRHPPVEEDHKNSTKPSARDKKKQKEQKRPRDKILRDKRLRKPALEIRKKGAFLGYTYRRPKGVIMALTPERGRTFIPRGQLSELYG